MGDHCRVAAVSAEKIAAECKGMDKDKAYIAGLLHDIGRRFGKSHFGHIVDGYNYMIELGFDDVAKICLTHSFPVQDIHSYLGNYDVKESILKEFDKKLRNTNYDDYDRLVQLCDSLSMPDGVVSMSERMDDVALRYNGYPENIRKMNYNLKEYFEKKLNRNIYEVVTDKKELWGL